MESNFFFTKKFRIQWAILSIIFCNTYSIAQSKYQNYCDTSRFEKANLFYNEANSLDTSSKSGRITLLKKALKIDTTFAKAYFKLGEIYHNKALLSQYDIQQQMYTSYYYRKASDNFLYALELCPDISNFRALFYLGEQFYQLQEYSLSGFYLKQYLDANLFDSIATPKAKLYYSNCLKWEHWNKYPHKINIDIAQNINTQYDEFMPTISADGQNIYYLSKTLKSIPNTLYSEIILEIYSASVINIDSNENWLFNAEKPIYSTNGFDIPINSLNINTHNNEIYLSTSKKIKQNNQYIETGIILHAIKENDKWELPIPIEIFNSTNTEYNGQPCISNDGHTLYFASNRQGGYGGYDLYYSEKNTDGTWGKPMNMGETINTLNNEISPFIHYDDHTLYFASNGHFGLGGFDLFMSRKDINSAWSTPVNLGKPINTPGDEKSLSVDARGIKGYFASKNRKGIGGSDIFSTDIPIEYRPKEMILLNGRIFNQDSSPLIANNIEIIDMKTNDFYTINFDNQTGSFSSIIPMEKTNYYIKLFVEGYSFANTIIKGSLSIHTYFSNIELSRLKEGAKFYLNHVNFNENNEFKMESIQVMADFSRYLTNNSTLEINIIGIDPNTSSHKMTKKQINNAEKTYNYLLNKGITKQRIAFKNDSTLIANFPKFNPSKAEILIEVVNY